MARTVGKGLQNTADNFDAVLQHEIGGSGTAKLIRLSNRELEVLQMQGIPQ